MHRLINPDISHDIIQPHLVSPITTITVDRIAAEVPFIEINFCYCCELLVQQQLVVFLHHPSIWQLVSSFYVGGLSQQVPSNRTCIMETTNFGPINYPWVDFTTENWRWVVCLHKLIVLVCRLVEKVPVPLILLNKKDSGNTLTAHWAMPHAGFREPFDSLPAIPSRKRLENKNKTTASTDCRFDSIVLTSER